MKWVVLLTQCVLHVTFYYLNPGLEKVGKAW